MQYILSEEEYQELAEAPDKLAKAHKEQIFNMCRQVAQTALIKVSWIDDPVIWGCIYTECPECGDTPNEGEFYCDCELSERAEDKLNEITAPYCDECIMRKHCTNNQSYSK